LHLLSRSWIFSIFRVNKKIDTIEYCQQKLACLNISIDNNQERATIFLLLSSALVQFRTEQTAILAGYTIDSRIYVIDILQEIIWENIAICWWTRYLRLLVIEDCILFFNAVWLLSIAFTGFLSQITYIAIILSIFRDFTRLSAVLIDLFQSILFQLMLLLLITVLLLIIRILVQCQDLLIQTSVEQIVQRFYFVSLFLQIFLTISLLSSAITILDKIYYQVDFVSAILATNFSKTSNYFFLYILLQSLSISASQLVQITDLIKCLLLTPVTDRTARDIWSRCYTISVEIQ